MITIITTTSYHSIPTMNYPQPVQSKQCIFRPISVIAIAMLSSQLYTDVPGELTQNLHYS
jgi:hypothetical protein